MVVLEFSRNVFQCGLVIGYKKILNSETAEQDAEAIMQAIDYNQSGAIDYSGIFCYFILKGKQIM